MDRAKTARNVVILLLIAAAVDFLPGGGRVATGAESLLTAAFAIVLGYFAYRLYREHRLNIHSLGDRHRALLYGALGTGLVTLTAKGRMWQTSFGEFAWFLLIGLVVYALVVVYRFWRSY